MAWTEFYVQTGADNMNAGSTNAASASVTQTNGNWSTTTNVFAAASGTPFSGVTIGEWASIYIDGTTSGAVYIAKVTAVGGSGANITLSSTNKFGTAPVTSATARSCKIGGAWASVIPVTTTLSPSAAIPSGVGSVRINIKAGTYTDTSTGGKTSLMTVAVGTTRLWWRGYNSTPGDLDSDTKTVLTPGINMPELSVTNSGAAWTLRQNAWFSFISFKAAATNPAVNGATGVVAYRCRMENTSSSNAVNAALAAVAGVFVRCFVKATSVATGVVTCTSTSNLTVFHGCYVTGGISCFSCTGNGSPIVIENSIIIGMTTNGINFLTGTNPSPKIINNTIIGSSATTGINFAGTFQTAQAVIAKNVISGFTNAVNQPATTQQSVLYGNRVFNCTNSYVGSGDTPLFLCSTESSNPYTSASDYTPHVQACGGNNLQILENTTYTTAMQIGAINRSRMVGFMRG